MSENDLQRFISAQQNSYNNALREIRSGRKTTHWMWFVFPQLKGLGSSDYAMLYGIAGLEEAAAYLSHDILGQRLLEISGALLELSSGNATTIMGKPDDRKLQSSMTLFSLVPNASPVFQRVLDKFFNGERDLKTISMLI